MTEETIIEHGIKYTVRTDMGNKSWFKYKTNILHRENDLPAIEYADDSREWWFDGVPHRINGPSGVFSNFETWYYYGKRIEVYSQPEYERWLKLNIFT